MDTDIAVTPPPGGIRDYEAVVAGTAPPRWPARQPADASPPPPTQAPAPSRARRIAGELRFAGPIVALVLGIKALVFSLGVVIGETIGDRTFPQFADRFAIWNSWDAHHYLSLAENGYQTVGDPANFIVFFPGYPLAVAFANALAPGGVSTAALVVSGVMSIGAALLLAYLARLDSGGDRAHGTRAAWFLLIFPTAYFLHIPYTESMFLALVLGSFYAARTGHWRTAGMIGALAALTRVNGMILVPALIVEAFLQYRQTRKLDRSWLWIALIGVGFASYLAINQHLYGNPFHFQQVQREHWGRYLKDPYTSVSGMLTGIGDRNPNDRQMVVIQEVLFLGIGLLASVLAWFWTRPSYAVWSFLNVLLFASTSWIQSTPRYAITIFPIFLLLASVGRRQWVAMLTSGWSLAWMAWFTALFATGRWAF
jgi:Mannosyltransferase (PIG-V)